MNQRDISFQAIITAFKEKEWEFEILEEPLVVHSTFEAHHTRIQVFAQAFPPIKGINIIAESAFKLTANHLDALLKLINLTNKSLTLGAFEYDIDRNQIVFRISNLFETTSFSPTIIHSLVHGAVGELDRLTPCINTIAQSSMEELANLDLMVLLQRDDWLPQANHSSCNHNDCGCKH